MRSQSVNDNSKGICVQVGANASFDVYVNLPG